MISANDVMRKIQRNDDWAQGRQPVGALGLDGP